MLLNIYQIRDDMQVVDNRSRNVRAGLRSCAKTLGTQKSASRLGMQAEWQFIIERLLKCSSRLRVCEAENSGETVTKPIWKAIACMRRVSRERLEGFATELMTEKTVQDPQRLLHIYS